MKQRPVWRIVLVLLAFVLVAAACSSDDDDGDVAADDEAAADDAAADDAAADEAADDDAAADEAAEEPEEDTTDGDAADADDEAADDDPAEGEDEGADAGGEATGEPVVVFTIMDENEALGQFLPDARAGLEAAVQHINANGGLGGTGRPIELRTCVGEVDPNINAECAREGVSSEAIAVVGPSICTNDTAYPIIAEAGLAIVSPLPCLGSTFTAPNVFNTSSGLPGQAAVEAAMARDLLGAESVALLLVAAPPILATESIFEAELNKGGLSVERALEYGRDQADATPSVAQFTGIDTVLNILAPPQAISVINTVASQGSDVQLVFASTNMNSRIIGATEGNNEGVAVQKWYRAPDSGVPGYDEFRAALDAIGEPQWIGDEFALQSWVGMRLLDHALQGSDGDFTRESVIEALSAVSGYDAGGISAPLDFTSLPGPLPEFPNIVVTGGFAGVVEDGQVVTLGDGEFIEVFG